MEYREDVAFTEELRAEVEGYLAEMHDYFQRGHTPTVKPAKGCNACSLAEYCLPKLMRQKRVADYVDDAIHEGRDFFEDGGADA